MTGLKAENHVVALKSGKAVGGQPGHKRVAEPSSPLAHPTPSHSSGWHSALAFEEAKLLERRQIFDIPTMCFEVVERRVYTGSAPVVSGTTVSFRLVAATSPNKGPNVRALGVHLTQSQLLPDARAAELIREKTGLSVSPATLLA